MKKAAIYCRLSEEDKNKPCAGEDSGSIRNQKAMLLQYAAEQGWEIYRIYSDDDYAGADRRRPQFNRLLEDAEQHKFDIVLCKTQSRFTRELELVEKYIHGLFPRWGIRFVSIVDNADTDNRGNKKSRQINGLVNEWYLEDLSDNIRSVLTSRRENGLHIGAFALYGYRKDPDRRGHLLIDEEAAAVVREVFRLFAGGYGKTAIARMLNDRGIPNPTAYKRQHGLRYRQAGSKTGTLWKYSAIADMLENEMYIGNMVQGRYGSVSYKTRQCAPRPKEQWYVVRGTHEPIIDRELWDRVCQRRAERSRPFRSGQIGIFARKARCAYCGYTLRSTKTKDRRYLQCPNRHIAADACPGAFIAVRCLEEAVLDEINGLAQEFLNPDEAAKRIAVGADLQERRRCLQSTLGTYRQKREELAAGLRSLYLDKAKGALPEPDYLALAQDFTAERERLERVIAEDERQLAALGARIALGSDRRALVEQYRHIEHLSREMVDTLIDFIAVGRREKGAKTVPVEIHWNF